MQEVPPKVDRYSPNIHRAETNTMYNIRRFSIKNA